jgi:hypothetical protein
MEPVTLKEILKNASVAGRKMIKIVERVIKKI